MVLPVNLISGVEALGIMAGANAQQAGIIETFSKVRQREGSAEQSRASASSIKQGDDVKAAEHKEWVANAEARTSAVGRKKMEDDALLKQSDAYDKSIELQIRANGAKSSVTLSEAQKNAEFNALSGATDQKSWTAAIRQMEEDGLIKPGDYDETYDPKVKKGAMDSLSETYQIDQAARKQAALDEVGFQKYLRNRPYAQEDMTNEQMNKERSIWANMNAQMQLQDHAAKIEAEFLRQKAMSVSREDYNPYKDTDYIKSPTDQMFATKTQIVAGLARKGIDFDMTDLTNEETDKLVSDTNTRKNEIYALRNREYKNKNPLYPEPISYAEAGEMAFSELQNSERISTSRPSYFPTDKVLSEEEGGEIRQEKAQTAQQQARLDQATSAAVGRERDAQMAKEDKSLQTMLQREQSNNAMAQQLPDMSGPVGDTSQFEQKMPYMEPLGDAYNPGDVLKEVQNMDFRAPQEAHKVVYPDSMEISRAINKMPSGPDKTIARKALISRNSRERAMKEELKPVTKAVGRSRTITKKTPEDAAVIAQKYATYEIHVQGILNSQNAEWWQDLSADEQMNYLNNI